MRPALALIAALGAPAAAQPLEWTWMADVEHDVIDPSKGITTQTVTLSVLMDYDAPWVVISATIFDTLGVAGAYDGQITGWEILNDLGELTGDLTSTDGSSLYNTNAGQLCLFGPCTSDNPVDVLQFTWEPDEIGTYDVAYVTETASALAWIGNDSADAVSMPADILHEAQLGWTVVPSPAGATPLGLLVLTRRRRRPAFPPGRAPRAHPRHGDTP